MFHLLVESQPRGARAGALRGGMASFALHSALIAGAVAATLQTTARTNDPHPVVPINYRPPPVPDEPPPPADGLPRVPGRIGLLLPSISPVIPLVIPPPSTAPFDPLDFSGALPRAGHGGLLPDADTLRNGARTVYAARLVDVEPELLSHPAVAYPEILRRAGIGGRTTVEAVIDTTGHAERGSIRVLAISHPLFARPAMDVVAASVYRPGKIDGRAVRVRVRIPIDFEVTARDLGASPAP